MTDYQHTIERSAMFAGVGLHSGVRARVSLSPALAGTGISVLLQPAKVAQKTFDADNMIGNYEWFHQQYEDVKAFDARLVAATAAKTAFEQSAGPRDSWKFDERQEWNRLNTIVLGLTGQRAAMATCRATIRVLVAATFASSNALPAPGMPNGMPSSDTVSATMLPNTTVQTHSDARLASTKAKTTRVFAANNRVASIGAANSRFQPP